MTCCWGKESLLHQILNIHFFQLGCLYNNHHLINTASIICTTPRSQEQLLFLVNFAIDLQSNAMHAPSAILARRVCSNYTKVSKELTRYSWHVDFPDVAIMSLHVIAVDLWPIHDGCKSIIPLHYLLEPILLTLGSTLDSFICQVVSVTFSPFVQY